MAFDEDDLNLMLAGYSNPIFNINNYVEDDFAKVCDVVLSPYSFEWRYVNTNENILYSDHRSWFYFIVLGHTIVKGGESGNVLGIKSGFRVGRFVQPRANSCGRLGRLLKGDGTDLNIRQTLRGYQQMGHEVSIWAKACPMQTCQTMVGGRKISISSGTQKEIEREYLRRFRDVAGFLPMCNKAEK